MAINTPTLRPYQKKAVNNILAAFSSGIKHVLLLLATGGGKTFIFSMIAKMAAEKGNRTMIFTHRAELLTQAGGSLKELGLQAYYIRPGAKYYSDKYKVFVAMTQTFNRRMDDPYWTELLKSCKLVIIDEVHRQDFNYLFESGLLEGKHVIGFTATPKRSGKMRQMALDYEKIVTTVPIKWLIDNNFLVNADTYDIGGIDFSDVPTRAMDGDYQPGAMFKKYNSPKVYKGAVKNWQNTVPNTKTLAFCVNIEHTIKTCLEFAKAGISAKYIVSNPPKVQEPAQDAPIAAWERYANAWKVRLLYDYTKEQYSGERTELFNEHKAGKFTVLCNAGIATTGYDDRSLETIIVLRATLSTALWLQMIGRGSRISPETGKTHFNILDFGGNRKRLGDYAEDRVWGLWHEKSEGKGLPPIKSCGFDGNGAPITGAGAMLNGCNRPIMAGERICPFCGFKYPKKEQKEVVLQLTKTIKSTKNISFAELHDYWQAKKYKPPWLWRQLWYRNKDQSIKDFGRKYGWSNKTISAAINFCNKNIL